MSTYLRYFYTPPDNTCIDKCDEDYYINGYECVKSCPENTFGMNKHCVSKCPPNLNFVVKEFTHQNDKDRLKICDNKCPDDYPYYYNDKEENINYCVAECKYFVLPENENFKSIECFDECPENYNFYIEYENLTIQCLQDCPIDMPYYVPREENENNEKYQCYENCPYDYIYTSYSSYLCKKECETGFIDYDEKKCVTECKFNQYKAKKEDDTNTYCLNGCNSEFGEFHSINKGCVKSCEVEGDYITVDITDPLNKKCECQNLFYVNEQGIKKCLRPDQIYCDDAKSAEGEEFQDYIYRIYNTKECVKYCYGFLSPSKDICYTGFKSCSEIDNNTHLIIEDDKLICDCKYRYYQYNVNSNRVKKCLGEKDECSFGSYYMYTPETKECSINCDTDGGYKIQFDDDKCFKLCPIKGKEEEPQDKCKCGENQFLLKISETKYDCNDACNTEFPYKIIETQQCVKKCLGTGYEILDKNECKTRCDRGMKIIEIEEGDKLREIAKYTCQCSTTWYYNNDEIECLTDEEVNCKDKNFK